MTERQEPHQYHDQVQHEKKNKFRKDLHFSHWKNNIGSFVIIVFIIYFHKKEQHNLYIYFPKCSFAIITSMIENYHQEKVSS